MITKEYNKLYILENENVALNCNNRNLERNTFDNEERRDEN